MVVILIVALGGGGDVDEGGSVAQPQSSETPVSPEIQSPPPSTANTSGTSPAVISDNDTDVEWAIYWYLCGSDLETESGFASSDLAEMFRVTLPQGITVIIETGGALRWHDHNIDPSVNSRYIYDKDGFQLIETIPRSNMADSSTLESFLRFCNDNFPAKKKAVIFWDHGGGSVRGMIYDDFYGNPTMSLAEMRRAFEAVSPPSKDDPPYELIGFDACLMATVDMVESLSGYARYMVASQELEPGEGWEYEGTFELLAANPSMDGAEFGIAICDSYYAGCLNSWMADEITLSLVDMRYADALLRAYRDVGAEALLNAVANVSYFGEFGRAARSAVNYGGNNEWSGYINMVDMGDLVRYSYHLLPDYGQSLLEVIEECVIYKVGGQYRDRASGLSCYYSYNSNYNEFSRFASMNSDAPFRWFYDYKITGNLSDEGVRYVEGLMREYSKQRDIGVRTIPTPRDLEDYPVTTRGDGFAVLDLGPEIASQLVGVYYYLAYFDLDYEIILILGRADDLTADWDKGVFEDRFFGYWGSLDDAYVYMELVDEADEYNLYAVPILLNNEEYTLSVSYIKRTGDYEILGARRGIEDDALADRDLQMLKPGDVVEPLLYLMFDLDDMDEEPTVMSFESIVVSESTRFEEMFLGDGIFIFIFEMVDIMGNTYLSAPAAFSIEDGEIYMLDLED